MKKITITFIILFVTVSIFAQDNTLSKFGDLCTACNNNTADYARSGCRTFTDLCDVLTADKEVFIEKEGKKIKRVAFAYQNDGQLEYGVKAAISFVNKKGKVVQSFDDGNMLIMSKDGRITRSVSTKMTNPSLLKLEQGETVLFVFATGLPYKKRDKLKVKINISKLDTSTRQEKVFKEMNAKI